MFAMFQVVVLCLAADTAPSYTVHVRELTSPEKAIRIPLTDPVSVLDAVERLKRASRELEQMDLWIARRTKAGEVKVLRIDWVAISRRGVSDTNYVIFAGDRLFLQARPDK